MKLRVKDNVVVLAGRDRGKNGAVTKVLPARSAVVVEGLGMVKRHTKPSNQHPRGGILEVARPIPAGKVALICPQCKKPTRIGYETGKDGVKNRICRKCKAVVK